MNEKFCTNLKHWKVEKKKYSERCIGFPVATALPHVTWLGSCNHDCFQHSPCFFLIQILRSFFYYIYSCRPCLYQNVTNRAVSNWSNPIAPVAIAISERRPGYTSTTKALIEKNGGHNIYKWNPNTLSELPCWSFCTGSLFSKGRTEKTTREGWMEANQNFFQTKARLMIPRTHPTLAS